MEKRKPLLSISIMTPGKTRLLQRCLDSVVKLCEAMPCELVITDTGCDESVRTLIHSYADRVVDVTWCDDFSAARNAGLAACNGEWFLFLDDDQIILDVGPIAEFFNSGDYREYDGATFLELNYENKQETRHIDVLTTRFFQKSEETHFEGIIHEQVVPFPRRVADIPARVGHYGYLFETPEAAQAHAKRNITLLEQALKQEPTNLHYASQLAQEFRPIHDWRAQKAHCENYLYMLEETGRAENQHSLGIFLGGIVDALLMMEEYEELLRKTTFFTHQYRIDEYTNAMFSCYRLQAFYKIADYEHTLLEFHNYIHAYQQYSSEKKQYNNRFFIEDAFRDTDYQTCLSYGLIAATEQEDKSTVSNAVELMEWDSPAFRLHPDVFTWLLERLDMHTVSDSFFGLVEKVFATKRFGQHLLMLWSGEDKLSGIGLFPYVRRLWTRDFFAQSGYDGPLYAVAMQMLFADGLLGNVDEIVVWVDENFNWELSAGCIYDRIPEIAYEVLKNNQMSVPQQIALNHMLEAEHIKGAVLQIIDGKTV